MNPFDLYRAFFHSPYRPYPTLFVIQLNDGSLYQNGKQFDRTTALPNLEQVKLANSGAKLVVVK